MASCLQRLHGRAHQHVAVTMIGLASVVPHIFVSYVFHLIFFFFLRFSTCQSIRLFL